MQHDVHFVNYSKIDDEAVGLVPAASPLLSYASLYMWKSCAERCVCACVCVCVCVCVTSDSLLVDAVYLNRSLRC